MDIEKGVAKSHVLALPIPFQGHVNPMMQFCKRLSSRGIKVTLVVPSPDVSMEMESDLIRIESIPEGSSEGVNKASQSYIENLKTSILKHLPIILESKAIAGDPVKVLVCDSIILPWTFDVMKRFGIPGASLFTQSAAVSAIYYHLYQGAFRIPLEEPEISLPSLPPLERNDLPSYMYDIGSYPYVLRAMLDTNLNFGTAKWLLFNTYDSLENEAVSWMKSEYPAIKTIGPCIPFMNLDKRFKDDKDYGLNLFKPNSSQDCIKWLDSKANGSVVYASFGTLASLGERQMAETAYGLVNSNCHFLWVVIASENNKLPENCCPEIQEKGLIVNWCPQLQVLAHPAVGCFVTHCGWNSTLEALSLGMPMVVVPQWTDQPPNAKFITDIWQVGLRARVNEKGIVTKEELEFCIKQVMEGENAEKFKKNATRLRELAKEAMSEGGTSDRNIEELVSSFSCL